MFIFIKVTNLNLDADCTSGFTIWLRVLVAFLIFMIMLQKLFFVLISSELNPYMNSFFETYGNNTEIVLVLIKVLVPLMHVLLSKVYNINRRTAC